MERVDEITEELRRLVESCRVVYDYLKDENASVRTIQMDTNNLMRVKQQLMQENELIRSKNEEARTQADSIIRKAQDRAKEIESAAAQKLLEAERVRVQAQKEVQKALDELFQLR